MGRSHLMLACAVLALSPLASRADPVALEPAASQSIHVAKNKSAAFHLDVPAGKIVIAEPDIAEIVATTDQSFYIRGKGRGATNVLVYDRDLKLSRVIDVRVGYDAAGLQEDIALALPGEHIGVSDLADGVLLTGGASTPAVAERAMALAERMAPKGVTSALVVRDTQQVSLDVRIVEVDRTALDDIGIDLTADSGGGIVFSAAQGLIGSQPAAGVLQLTPRLGTGSLTATLHALEQKGHAHTLAKPNLSALSGKEASFLAGGEIPVPVPNGQNGVTVEYRQFGVQLNFTPTLYADGMIELKVKPEVSELDPNNGVTLQGFRIPALTIRRAATTIALRDGQSFAIAGLFQHGYAQALSQVPGASNIPVLGALFRSSHWKREETELVIVVTPRLVSGHEPIVEPVDAAAEPSSIDTILQGMVDDKPAKAGAQG